MVEAGVQNEAGGGSFCQQSLVVGGFLTLFMSVIVKAFGDNFYYAEGYYPSYTFLRHLFLGGSVLLFLGAFFLAAKPIRGTRLLVHMTILGLFLGGFSLLVAVGQGGWLLASFKALIFMLLPVLLAFLISNSASSRTIYNGMKCLFWLVASLYLWEVMPQISAPAELLTIDFFESYSPLESSALAPHFYGLLLYFTFCSSSKGYFILAALGNILAFKRVNVLAALGLLLMGKFPYHRKKVPDWLKEGTILFFILLTLVEYQLLKRPEALTELADRLGFPLVKGLLMGRNEFVETLLSAGFVSSGFGSTGPALEQLLGKKGLELDLMQVALELGPVGVIALVNLIWRGIGKSLAEYLILLLLFFNMASSYQLTDSYGMLYNFLCLFLLQREVKGGYE